MDKKHYVGEYNAYGFTSKLYWEKTSYQNNGRTALLLNEKNKGMYELFTVVSTNLSELNTPENHIWVKENWGDEEKALLKLLEDKKIIGTPITNIQYNYNEYSLREVLVR